MDRQITRVNCSHQPSGHPLDIQPGSHVSRVYLGRKRRRFNIFKSWNIYIYIFSYMYIFKLFVYLFEHICIYLNIDSFFNYIPTSTYTNMHNSFWCTLSTNGHGSVENYLTVKGNSSWRYIHIPMKSHDCLRKAKLVIAQTPKTHNSQRNLMLGWFSN